MTDWPSQAADLVEQAATTVRERAVVPVERTIRAIVFGLVVAMAATAALVLLSFGTFRGLVELLQEEVWAAWLVLGGIQVGAGAFLWTKRTP
jgi:hypothetical protein